MLQQQSQKCTLLAAVLLFTHASFQTIWITADGLKKMAYCCDLK